MDGHHDSERTDWISLTSIGLPGFEMGRLALHLLRDESAPARSHLRVTLPVELAHRASSLRVPLNLLGAP